MNEKPRATTRRVPIVFEEDFLREFDAYTERAGFSSRNEAVRDAMRKAMDPNLQMVERWGDD